MVYLPLQYCPPLIHLQCSAISAKVHQYTGKRDPTIFGKHKTPVCTESVPR